MVFLSNWNISKSNLYSAISQVFGFTASFLMSDIASCACSSPHTLSRFALYSPTSGICVHRPLHICDCRLCDSAMCVCVRSMRLCDMLVWFRLICLCDCEQLSTALVYLSYCEWCFPLRYRREMWHLSTAIISINSCLCLYIFVSCYNHDVFAVDTRMCWLMP